MRAGVALLGAGALVLFATLSWRLWAASSLGGLIFAGGAALVASALIGRARKPARVWASEPVLRTLHARALGLVVDDWS